MSNNPKEYMLEELRKMKCETDVEKFNSTTEQQINEQIISDSDMPNLTDDEMKEFDFPKKRENKNESKK